MTYSTTSMSRPPGVSTGHSISSLSDGTNAVAPRAPQVHSASDLGNVCQIQYVVWGITVGETAEGGCGGEAVSERARGVRGWAKGHVRCSWCLLLETGRCAVVAPMLATC